MSNQPREDQAWEALLARQGEISRTWRAASEEEPSGALDDSIRAAARRAVNAGPRTGGSHFGGRWRVPLSVAALLVISASVTLLVAERKEHVPRMALEPVPSSGVTTRDEPAAAPPAEADGTGARALGRSASPQPADRKSAESGRAGSVTPAPVLNAQEGGAGPQVPRVARPDNSAEAAPAAAAPPTTTTEHEEALAESKMKNEAKVMVPAARESTVQPALQDAATGEVALRRRQEQSSVPTQAPEARRGVSAAAPAAPAPSQAQPRPQAGPAGASADEGLEPAAWINRILELRREGKVKESDDSLKAFRERYPEYPLPAELRPSQ